MALLDVVEYPPLDPWTVRLSKHTVDRYMQRRGWTVTNGQARKDAELAIRNLLARCAHKYAPVRIRPGRTAVRIYRGSGMKWVVSADNRVVITMWSEHSHR